MQHKELTHAIIGCAMKVHRTLDSGFRENIYQRALAIELRIEVCAGAGDENFFYDGIQIGTRRVDFFVEGTMLVELKAVTKLDDAYLAQAINYCQAFNLPSGS